MKELVGGQILLPAWDRWASTVGVPRRRLSRRLRRARRPGAAPRRRHARRARAVARATRSPCSRRTATSSSSSTTPRSSGRASSTRSTSGWPPASCRLILADSEAEVIFVDELFADHLLRASRRSASHLPVAQGRAHRRRRARVRPPLLRAPRARPPEGPRRARGDRSGRAHVHRRHDRAAERGLARPASRDAEPLPHRHDRRPRPRSRLPPPDPDVPRRLHGRHPRDSRHRRHLGLPTALRAGGRHEADRGVPGRLDDGRADDARHDPRPPGVPPGAVRLHARPRLRRLPDAARRCSTASGRRFRTSRSGRATA